jgi:hypothetical protein
MQKSARIFAFIEIAWWKRSYINNCRGMIKVDLDLGQSDWSSKDWEKIDMTMKAIERMLKIERLFSNDK